MGLSDDELRAAAMVLLMSPSCWDAEAMAWVISNEAVRQLWERKLLAMYYDTKGFGSYRLNAAGLAFVKGESND